MRVLVVEPVSEGHRFTYLRYLIEALAQLGLKPVLATTAFAASSIEFDHQLAASTHRFVLDASYSHERGGMKAARARLRTLKAAASTHRPDHIIVPYADGLVQALTFYGRRVLHLPRHVELEGLLFRGAFAYPGRGIGHRITSRVGGLAIAASPIDMLHVLDPLVLERLQCTRSRAELSLMPDPVEEVPLISKAEARSRLNLPLDGRLVSCSGRLDARKGVDLLVRAFLSADLKAQDRLLLAGKASPSIRSLIDREYRKDVERGRLIVMDRYVSDEELALVNAASDVVSAPYPRHIGSASIVIRAAAAKRPVLGSDFGWIGHVVPRFDLGWTCRVSDVGTFAASLVTALDAAASWTASTKSTAFTTFHSVPNFEAHWTSRLRQRLNLSPSSDFVSW